MMESKEITTRDFVIALFLFAATFLCLGFSQRNQGVMRDEGTYFRAAERYWGWFAELGDNIAKGKLADSFNKQNIHRYWSDNSEHPVLFKTLFAFSWRAFHKCNCTERGAHFHSNRYTEPHKTLNLMSEISSFRIFGWFFTAATVMLIFIFGIRIENRIAGFSAALLYITIPRVFFHGQLACFDSGVTFFWLLVVYMYFRSLSWARFGIYAGICFGLALATKHNAWFIPPLLLIHYLCVVWPDVSFRPFSPPRIPLVFIAMAILGPLIFWLHWPWLWFDTINHLKGYFGFHLHHSYYNIEYLGKNWGLPPLPISYPFGMTLFTVPTIMLVLMFVGLGIYIRTPLLTLMSRWIDFRPPPLEDPFRYPAKRNWLCPGKGLNPRIGILFVLNALFPLVLIALPSTPIFGGTKHFMSAFPFMTLFAGIAVSRITQIFCGQGFIKRMLPLTLAICVALPGALNTFFTHPFGLSQYNALAGGPAGGADLGLNRQFWGYATRQLLEWMNDTFDDNARVYFHDTSHDAYGSYVRDGLLRPDIYDAGMELPAIQSSNYALVIHELHFNKYDYWIWDVYNSPRPIKVLTLDGVPVVSVYSRSKKR